MLRLFLSLIPATRAAPLGYISTRSSNTLVIRETLPVCSIEGNADFYGLGIRIGIYLQWTSALLANRYVPDAVRGLLITNSIFLLAVSIAALQSTVSGTLKKAEALVIQHLCFGFLFSILTIWGYRVRRKIKTKVVFSLADVSFRLTLSTAICAYGVWFWFVGNNKLSEEGCVTVTFIFAKIDSLSSVRYFYQIQSIILLVIYGILLLRNASKWVVFATKSLFFSLLPTGVLALVDQLWDPDNIFLAQFVYRWFQTAPLRFWLSINRQSLRSANPEFPVSSLDFPFINGLILSLWTCSQYFSFLIFQRPMRPKAPPLISLSRYLSRTTKGAEDTSFNFRCRLLLYKLPWADIFSILNLVCLIWAIAATEFTLAWNKVTDVHSVISTGQLIPMIIGIASFAQIAYTIVLYNSQVALTDLLLRRLIDPPKPPQRPLIPIDPDFQDPNSSLCRYPLKGGYEAVFYRQYPRRRRSVDILMSSASVPNMSLGVARKDLSGMVLLKARHPALSQTRRHSVSYGSPTQCEAIQDENNTMSAKLLTPNPSLAIPADQKPKPKTGLFKAILFLCFIYSVLPLLRIFSFTMYLITRITTCKRSQLAIRDLGLLILGVLRRKSAQVEELVTTWNATEIKKRDLRMLDDIQRRSSLSSMTPSELSNERKLYRKKNQIESVKRLAQKWMTEGLPDVSSSSSLSSSIPPNRKPGHLTPPDNLPGPRGGTGNWGPHIAYTFPEMHSLQTPRDIPPGPLHTILSSLSYASTRFMPAHPHLSAMAASFADILAELGVLYRRRVKGRITREQQDKLFREWVQEFRREYIWKGAQDAMAWVKRFEEGSDEEGSVNSSSEAHWGLDDIGQVIGETVARGIEIEKRRRS